MEEDLAALLREHAVRHSVPGEGRNRVLRKGAAATACSGVAGIRTGEPVTPGRARRRSAEGGCGPGRESPSLRLPADVTRQSSLTGLGRTDDRLAGLEILDATRKWLCQYGVATLLSDLALARGVAGGESSDLAPPGPGLRSRARSGDLEPSQSSPAVCPICVPRWPTRPGGRRGQAPADPGAARPSPVPATPGSRHHRPARVCASLAGSKISLRVWPGWRAASGCESAARSVPGGCWPGSAGLRCLPHTSRLPAG